MKVVRTQLPSCSSAAFFTFARSRVAHHRAGGLATSFLVLEVLFLNRLARPSLSAREPPRGRPHWLRALGKACGLVIRSGPVSFRPVRLDRTELVVEAMTAGEPRDTRAGLERR